MNTSVNPDGNIRLSEIFVPVILVAERERLSICERDGVFEILVVNGDGMRLMHPVARGQITGGK